MALADKKILNPIRYHQDNTDVVIAQASAMKELFDQGAEDVRVKLNGVIDELIATTGAQQIGIDPAKGLGNTLADALTNVKNYMNLGASGIPAEMIGPNSGDNVQSQLEWIIKQIWNIVLGQIPDGTITMDKLSTTLADLINGHTTQLAHIAYTDVDKFQGNDSQKLNAFFQAYAGKTVRLPRTTFTLSDTVIIPINTEVIAYGASFQSSSHITLLKLESGVNLKGLELIGAGYQTVNSSGRAIEIIGTVSDYKKDIAISDCKFKNIGFYGIYMKFVDNVIISNCKMDGLGYAGILGLSVKNVQVIDKTDIRNVTGSSGNSYGVIFTRDSVSSDLNAYPRSYDCLVRDSYFENIPWEALDTHAGENIKFINNTIKNCPVGIAFVGAAGVLASQKGIAIGNSIYNGNGAGIKIAGAGSVIGTAEEYANDFIIQGNNLIRCGIIGNGNEGAIHLVYTKGANVLGNDIKESYEVGICLYHTNIGFSVGNNVIIDPHGSTSSYGIRLRSGYNQGNINGNSLLRIDATLNANVGNQGIRCDTNTNTDIAMGINYITCTTPFSGMLGSFVHYAIMGMNMKVYASNGSPEGVITATVGSICLNYLGNEGTTFYIKEKGMGNTGWKNVNTPHAGTTDSRPSAPIKGYMYFDTVLNKPIWWNGSVWNDATGTTV